MKKVWGIFWTCMMLLGSYALWTCIQLPSESKNIFLLGMSKSRLGLCALMAVLILCCLIGAIFSFSKKESAWGDGRIAGTVSFILIFALIIANIFLTPPVGKTALERSLLERLQPLIYWGFSFSILSLILLLIQKFTSIRDYQFSSTSALIWGIVIFLLMTGAIYYALKTGNGLDPISGTFYRQGVSLLEGQLIVPLLFLYPLLPLFTILGPKISGKKAGTILTILTGLLIWGAAVYFWQTTVFEGRSYFAPALRLPNNNFYPASDAENYELLAQSILLGNGFRNGMTVVRPLYVAFLALLHVIFGNDYIKLTNGQILFLAVIPVLVFLIAKQLKHTAAGLVAAAWVIWREIYSIRLTPLVQVSNSRLLMSDLPTMLLVALVIYCTVKWYRYDKEESRAFLCGGMIGTAMLLRTQCFVLIPTLWLIFLCSQKPSSKKWGAIFFSLLGLAITFVPWTVWGKIHPNTTVNEDVSEGQYLVSLYRTAVNESDPNADLWELISSHPSETFQAVSAHFLNNEISSVLILPMRLIKPQGAEQLFYEDDLFWYRENARETIEQNRTLLIIYLAVISFGIISAYRKNKFGGMIPFLIHIVYNLGNAFALTSGFRFILPVDWIMLFYFALGCAAVLDFLNRLLLFNFAKPIPEASPETSENAEGNDLPKLESPLSEIPANNTAKTGQGWRFVCTSLLLVLIGAILPLCEIAIPRRYSQKTPEELQAKWNSLGESSLDLSKYPAEDLVILEGRAFYPRYYAASEGDSGGSSSAKREMDIDRLVWMFHDNEVHVLCCPLTEEQTQTMITARISDPMDVMVAGIQREDYIEVLEMRRFDANRD